MMRILPPTWPFATRLRLLARRLAGALIALVFGTAAALAQPIEEADPIDPPGRVGSITLLAGPVTMVDLATGSREEALLNWPVTGGWRIETGRAARAEVRIGSTALRLDDDTTVDFARLDDQFIQIAVLRGSVSLRLRNREVLGEIEVLTQRERMVFHDVGSYRIDVDRPAGLTLVTAFSGRVRVDINRSTFFVSTGQRGELAASPMVSFEISGAVADRFDEWVAVRDAREDSIRSAAYVSRETTGVEQLDEYGDWRTVEEYGPVWFPRGMPATWAPYRFGRWVWVSPWGWTWIDEAPWGFAPLHYGRWVVVGGAWGWFPGVVVARPVFAPALVAWFGAPGVSVTVGAPIGWFPLGPREVYVPVHRHTPRYLRVVNVQHVPNVSAVTIVQTPRYVHRHPDRSTWVPGDRFGRPEPVHSGQRPPPSEWRQYIARPQPPANVPNTKRRQANEGMRSPTPTTVPTPTPALDSRPMVRPPSPVPGAAEAPRPAEGPRAMPAPRVPEAPRAVEAPRALPAAPPGAARDERRMAPRAPSPSAQPQSAPYTPPTARTLPRETAPAPQPSISTPAPSAPPVERPRSREMTPGLAPSVQPPATPYAPPRPRELAPAPVAPRSADAPAARGRVDGAAPREGQRQAPRAPAVPATGAPPAAAAPQPAPPAAAAPGGRESGRAAPARPVPPARQDGGEPRGAERGGPGREASR